MADVFVSYSRRDSAFVRGVVDELTERGKEVWLDTEGIADGEVFPDALKHAIESSSGFVFVISPDSAASPYCGQEVELALALNKRIVPVVHRRVPDEELPEGIRVRNWIPGDDPACADRVVGALDHDLAHVKEHTRWSLKALEWEGRERDKSLLLRGSELAGAERWLAGAGGKEPEPTELQRDYVRAAHAAGQRRQRLVTAISVGVALVSIALVVVALLSRQQAQHQRTVAVKARGVARVQAVQSRAEALAATARANQDSDPQIALALAIKAVRAKPIPQALFALRGALDGAAVLAQYALTEPCADADTVGGDAQYSPTAPVLAIEGCAGTVTLRDAATGAVLRSRKVSGRGTAGANWSNDGRLLAVGDRGAVHIVDGRTLKEIRRIAVPRFAGGFFFPDGRSLVVSSSREKAAGARLFRVTLRGGRLHALVRTPSVHFADVTDGGRHLVVTTSRHNRGILSLLDARTGRVLRSRVVGVAGNVLPTVTAPATGDALGVAFRAAGGATRVQLWSASALRPVRTLESLDNEQVSNLIFNNDASRLAVATGQGHGDVRLVRTGERLASFSGLPNSILDLTFSAQTPERLSIIDSTGTVRIYGAQGASRLDTFADLTPRGQVGLGMDGTTLTALGGAGGDDSALLRWRLSDGKPLPVPRLPAGTLPTHFTIASGNELPLVSRDGRHLLLPARRGGRTVLFVRSARTGRTVGTVPYLPYQAGDFRPGSHDILLYDGLSAGETFKTPPTIVRPGSRRKLALQTDDQGSFGFAAYTMAYSPDGRLIVGADSHQTIAVWNADDGKLLHTFQAPSAPSDTVLDPSNRLVLVAGQDGVGRIFDWRTGRKVRSLTGHTAGLGASDFSPDGRYVFTTSNDLTARIWSVRTGRELRRYTLPSPPGQAADSPASHSFAVAMASGAIRVFDFCTNCEDPKALLAEAAKRGRLQLTASERAVVDGA